MLRWVGLTTSYSISMLEIAKKWRFFFLSSILDKNVILVYILQSGMSWISVRIRTMSLRRNRGWGPCPYEGSFKSFHTRTNSHAQAGWHGGGRGGSRQPVFTTRKGNNEVRHADAFRFVPVRLDHRGLGRLMCRSQPDPVR